MTPVTIPRCRGFGLSLRSGASFGIPFAYMRLERVLWKEARDRQAPDRRRRWEWQERGVLDFHRGGCTVRCRSRVYRSPHAAHSQFSDRSHRHCRVDLLLICWFLQCLGHSVRQPDCFSAELPLGFRPGFRDFLHPILFGRRWIGRPQTGCGPWGLAGMVLFALGLGVCLGFRHGFGVRSCGWSGFWQAARQWRNTAREGPPEPTRQDPRPAAESPCRLQSPWRWVLGVSWGG